MEIQPQAEVTEENESSVYSEVPGGSVEGESNEGTFPTLTEKEVLKVAAFGYLKAIHPTKVEDLSGFLEYMQEMSILLTETACSGEFPSFLNNR